MTQIVNGVRVLPNGVRVYGPLHTIEKPRQIGPARPMPSQSAPAQAPQQSGYKVFFCVPSGRGKVTHSVTSADGHGGCEGRDYHRADEIAFSGSYEEAKAFFHENDPDAAFPKTCGCGYAFQDDDRESRALRPIYVRQDTGEEVELGRAPVGACWDAFWLREGVVDHRTGPDGRNLVVKTPGGDWEIDSRASNCTMKDDNAHRCWVRHGRPEDGTLHVDKDGLTCQAGAGSIQCGSYHGFLRHGSLVTG